MERKRIMIRFFSLIMSVLGVIAIAVSIILKMDKSASISVIGGSDGPTSYFITGKIGADFSTAGIIVGIALIILAIFLMVRKKNRIVITGG